MAELPIIVLAFANEQEGRRYLRDLPEELRRLQEILREAERNGLCRLELLPNATLDQIFDVFTRNRDQVTILHFAGHADSGRLLLESSAAGGAPAHAAGLATFLGQCGGLQLVFLNGCSTRAQVARLLEAGVAAVIATARAIDDGMARAFAVAFYTELASGLPLRAAYEKARGRVLAAHDTVPEAYYGHRDFGTTSESANPDPTDDNGFPWEFRPGTELVERWSLPDAAGNPEFGLPNLPERDLPESPFRHLAWFTAEQAEVFFGRGYQVRELYEQVIDATGPPILLLYGASGVGKSSLLDAGLVPRLETGGQTVRYYRRDQQKGLSGSLRDIMQRAGELALFNEGWRAEEARLGQPLVVVLDQVEEVFTRPDPAQPRELDEFVAVLGAALGNRDARPRGKLVLGFRKEWLAELDRRLAEAKLSRTKVFLKQLDRRGIIEAIRGPARPGRLQRQYRLAIEDGLPEVIADDLLADAGSALAPTLQVLLTKMWERAWQSNPDQPRFDRALYESLKAEGYLLKDVLDEGLKAIGRWNPAVEQSGLALDVLVCHTTDLGTASQRTRAELDQRYAHQANVLDGLLGRCKDHYLLIESEPHPGSPTRSTRLAHDLLAPLVQQRFRLSIAPGQRARRLLENRAPEWQDGKTGPVLDSTDLPTVVEGALGMRVWTADEILLVEASRRAEEQEKAEEQERARRLHEAEEGQRQAEAERQRETECRLKEQKDANEQLRKGSVRLKQALAVTVVVAAIAGFLGWEARRETKKAALTSANLMLDRGIALAKQDEAQRGLLWMARALATNPPSSPDLDRAARANIAAWDDQVPTLQRCLSHPQNVIKMVLSPEGRTLATTVGTWDDQSDAFLWDTATGEPIAGPLLALGAVTAIAFSRDGSILATGTGARTNSGGRPDLYPGSGEARLWNSRTGQPIGPPLNHESAVTAVALTPDGAGFFTASTDGMVYRWRVPSGEAAGPPLRHDLGVNGYVQALAVSPDGSRLLAGTGHIPGQKGTGYGRLWDARTGEPIGPVLEHQDSVRVVAFSPDGKLALTGGDENDGTVRVWEPGSGQTLGAFLHPNSTRSHARDVSFITFSPDRHFMLTGSIDMTAKLWDVSSRQLLVTYNHPQAVESATFSPDGRLVATGCSDKRARLFETLTGRRIGQPIEHRGQVVSVAFEPTQGRLLTDGCDPIVRAWDVTSVRSERRTIGLGAQIDFVAFSPDGRTMLAKSLSGRVWFWNPATGDPTGRSITIENTTNLERVVFSPDGRYVATGSQFPDHSEARVWEVASGEPVSPPLINSRKVSGIAKLVFGSTGKTILTKDYDGEGANQLQLWEINGGRLLWKDVQPLSSQVLWKDVQPLSSQEVLIHPGGRTIFNTGGKGIRVLDAATGHLTGQEFSYPGIVFSLCLSPSGTVLAVGGDDRTARLWDVATGRPIGKPMEHLDTIRGLAFSLDGKLIATGSDDKTARVWDATTGQPLTQPLAHFESGILGVGFLHDGKSIVTTVLGVTARLWDVATAKEIGPGLSHSGFVPSFAVSPDGRVILTGSWDGTIKLWDVPGLEEGDIREIGNRVQAKTGMHLDEHDGIHFLDAADWRSLTPRNRKVTSGQGAVPKSDESVGSGTHGREQNK